MYRCPKCQFELPADARFCKHCGFNQTNARIASMPPSVQGVQRQVPPTPPAKAQQAQQAPPRTIQPSNRQIPQQQVPTNNMQGRQQPSTMQGQGNQQNVPMTPPFSPQMAPGRTSTPQNASPAMPPVIPSFKQTGALQENNGVQQLVRQPPPMASLPTTPQPWAPPQQGPSGRGQQTPAPPQEQLRRQNQETGYIQEQVIRTSTPPPQINVPNTPLEPLQWSVAARPNIPTVNQENHIATSKAAQHWRQSWLDRQHDEAGPAVGVSRGQALVREPLLVMQNSIARMRAIILPKNGKSGKDSRLGFILPAAILVFLIGILGIYIFSTYSSASLSTNLASSGMGGGEPTLTMKTSKTTTVVVGQPVSVHGEHFGANDTILFSLDGTQVKSVGGKPVSAQTNDRGTFDATIPTAQLAGEYVLQAQDSRTGQHGFLTIQTTASTTTNVIKLSATLLSFTLPLRHNASQDVSITNTSGATISWQAVAVSNNQAGWLLLTGGKTGDTLDAGKTDTIHVSTLTAELAGNTAKHPYTGEVIITVAGQGQVVLPVKLVLIDPTEN